MTQEQESADKPFALTLYPRDWKERGIEPIKCEAQKDCEDFCFVMDFENGRKKYRLHPLGPGEVREPWIMCSCEGVEYQCLVAEWPF